MGGMGTTQRCQVGNKVSRSEKNLINVNGNVLTYLKLFLNDFCKQDHLF